MINVEISCKTINQTNSAEITMYVELPINDMDEIDESVMSLGDSDKMIQEEAFKQYGIKICSSSIRVLGSNY